MNLVTQNVMKMVPTQENMFSNFKQLVISESRNRLVGYFGNVDFRLQHDSLKKLVKGKRIYLGVNKQLLLEDLKIGEFVAFINRDKTAVKLFGANNLLVYQKAPYGQKIHPGAIFLIPRYFSGKTIDLNRANAEAILADYAKYLNNKTKLVS